MNRIGADGRPDDGLCDLLLEADLPGVGRVRLVRRESDAAFDEVLCDYDLDGGMTAGIVVEASASQIDSTRDRLFAQTGEALRIEGLGAFALYDPQLAQLVVWSDDRTRIAVHAGRADGTGDQQMAEMIVRVLLAHLQRAEAETAQRAGDHVTQLDGADTATALRSSSRPSTPRRW